MFDVFRHNWRRNSREFLHFPAKGKNLPRPLAIVVKKSYNVLSFVFEDQNRKFRRNGETPMAEAKKTNYGNESISSLKGADRVRKRPGVIFGSDGLDGCEHAVFEILSNSIDEAREGHGKLITVTR